MMDRRQLLRLTGRLALAWVALSALTLAASVPLVRVSLPLLQAAVNLLQDDFTATLKLAEVQHAWAIQMQPLTVRPISMTDQVQLRQFVLLKQYITHVSHTLVPVVLLLTGVVAWPFRRWREMALRGLLAVPALLVVAVLSAPVLLIGQVQMTLVQLATRAGAPFHEPWMVTLMIFMESGGRWLLPIACAVGCIAIARSASAPVPPAAPPAPRPAEPSRAADLAFPPVSGS